MAAAALLVLLLAQSVFAAPRSAPRRTSARSIAIDARSRLERRPSPSRSPRLTNRGSTPDNSATSVLERKRRREAGQIKKDDAKLFRREVGHIKKKKKSYGVAVKTLSDDDLDLLNKVCKQPRPTETSKKNALRNMVYALNSVVAPYNIHAGTVLGLVRGCYIFDTDLDFVIERDWLKDNLNRTIEAVSKAGFTVGHAFGQPSKEGWELTVNALPSMEEQVVAALGEGWLGEGSTSKVSLDHVDGIRVDLFTISRKSSYYEWPLWLYNSTTGKQDIMTTCNVTSTHAAPFKWLGMDVQVPVPLNDVLTSLYGKDYLTPQNWTWDVEPFTVGSCRKPENWTWPSWDGPQDMLRAQRGNAISLGRDVLVVLASAIMLAVARGA